MTINPLGFRKGIVGHTARNVDPAICFALMYTYLLECFTQTANSVTLLVQ